jgi:hypothetical protein
MSWISAALPHWRQLKIVCSYLDAIRDYCILKKVDYRTILSNNYTDDRKTIGVGWNLKFLNEMKGLGDFITALFNEVEQH